MHCCAVCIVVPVVPHQVTQPPQNKRAKPAAPRVSATLDIDMCAHDMLLRWCRLLEPTHDAFRALHFALTLLLGYLTSKV